MKRGGGMKEKKEEGNIAVKRVFDKKEDEQPAHKVRGKMKKGLNRPHQKGKNWGGENFTKGERRGAREENVELGAVSIASRLQGGKKWSRGKVFGGGEGFEGRG